MKRFYLALLGLLVMGATIQTTPPPPPGMFGTSTTKLLSPKATEQVKSLGTPMFIAPVLVVPSGFSITNSTVSGTNITLGWASGFVQVQQSTDFITWVNVGLPTDSGSITVPATGNRGFFRLQKVDQPGPFKKQFGGVSNDSGQSVVTDESGIYLSGYFMGTAEFGGDPFTSSGGYDLFLAKYSTSGTHLWSLKFGTTGNELVNSICLDLSGNIILGGSIYSTANVGTTNLVSAGDADAFLAKYSSTGEPLWSIRFGANFPDVIKSVAVDSVGNIYVAGFFQGVVNVGGTTITSWGNGIDLLLAKFNSNGGLIWVKNFYNGGTEYGNSVLIDPNNNVLLVGYFNGYINFTGGQSGPGLLTTPGGYIAKFNESGDHQWSRAYGSPSARFWTAALDLSGNIGVSGDFSQSTDLGGGTITGTSWGLDMFTAKYSGLDGTYQWAAPILGFQASIGRPANMTYDNAFVVTGYLQGRYTFGTQTIISSPGITDGFVARFSDTGLVQTSMGYGSTGSASGNGVHGKVATGYFSGTAGSLTSAGAIDIILIKE